MKQLGDITSMNCTFCTRFSLFLTQNEFALANIKEMTP